MADALTIIAEFLDKPPVQLAAGVILAGTVWRFFDRVEAILKDDTKLQIAVWLLGVKVGQKLEWWPETFAKVLDRVFGDRHLSWKCFSTSCVASYGSALVAIFLSLLFMQPLSKSLLVSLRFMWAILPALLLLAFVGNVIPDYCLLGETRLILRLMQRNDSVKNNAWLLLADFCIKTVIGFTAAYLTLHLMPALPNGGGDLRTVVMSRELAMSFVPGEKTIPFVRVMYRTLWILPAFFTSIWLWLYAGSGFLLKFARRFDVGFQWFNSKVDIEHKPLSAIGLIAGAFVALLWWTAVIVKWVV